MSVIVLSTSLNSSVVECSVSINAARPCKPCCSQALRARPVNKGRTCKEELAGQVRSALPFGNSYTCGISPKSISFGHPSSGKRELTTIHDLRLRGWNQNGPVGPSFKPFTSSVYESYDQHHCASTSFFSRRYFLTCCSYRSIPRKHKPFMAFIPTRIPLSLIIPCASVKLHSSPNTRIVAVLAGT